MDSIITISRQYGSGGKEIGRRLAQRLGIPFYDKDIIANLAKKTPFQNNIFNKEEGMMANSLIYAIAMGMNSYNFREFSGSAMSIEDQTYMNQCAVIRKIAKEGPCIIVGRCADYILEQEDIIKLYIWSSIESRIHRAKEVYGESHNKAQENILRIDKKRSAYYRYHSGQRWGNVSNYDMVLRSDLLGIEGTVDILENIINMKNDECIEDEAYAKEIL